MRWPDIDPLIQAALAEDLPAGDVTSDSLIPPGSVSTAVFLAKAPGVLAGIDVAGRVFAKIDPAVRFRKRLADGRSFRPGDVLAEVKGSSRSLLKGERTALNFLQRMSGIATKTRKFVEAAGPGTRILDTRKTTPGLRLLEKYAVRMGGGVNHRFSLSDMVLIKDNHIRLVGGVAEAVRRGRAGAGTRLEVEVEVTSLAEAREAVAAGAGIIMLDNMPLARMRRVVRELGGRVPVEVSGRVRLDQVPRIAALGVDFISVGGLTHSYDSTDISLEFESGQSDRRK